MSIIEQPDADIQPNAVTLASISRHQSLLPTVVTAVPGESSGVTIQQGLVPISELNRSMHARARRVESHAQWMAWRMKEGHKFHAIEIFWDPVLNVFWVADGEHRIMAHVLNDKQYILANIHVGSRQEALKFAFGCDLGLRRKGPDWRQCVRLILQDPESAKLTARAIARQYGIDHKTVTKYKRELGGFEPDGDESRTVEASTGEIPQFVGRTPEDKASLADGQVPSSAAPIQEVPAASPPDRTAKALKLARSIIGKSHPVALQEVLESIPKVLESDASLDVATMFALALTWGVDLLRCPPGSSPLRVTPKQWLAQVRANKAAEEAASKALDAAVTHKSPIIDRVQHVIGAKTLSLDEIVEALRMAKLLPGSSNPKDHIRFELSQNQSIVSRVDGKSDQYFLDDLNPYRIAQTCAGNS